MGKKLIIKGADFSENGMFLPAFVWYNNGALYSPSSSLSQSTLGGQYGGGGLISDIFTGVPINIFRIFYPSSEINNTIGMKCRLYRVKVGDTITQETTPIKSFIVTTENIDASLNCVSFILDTPIILETNESIVISVDDDSPYKKPLYYNKGASQGEIIPICRCTSSSSTFKVESGVYICAQYGLIE